MALTQTQINEIFASMGLPAPSSAVATSLEAIPNTYDALNTIIDLPVVQTEVIPILAMFDLALGHDPTSATLASMVENNGGNIASIANQFVESQAFANLYNAGALLSASTVVDASNSGIITALFVNGLGHPPTATTLQGFFGLTLGQAFLEFTQSNAIAETPTIDASLTNIMELAAGIPPQAAPIVTQTFTLTAGSDTVTTADITAGTTNVTINAPLVPPTGGQLFSQPTLQNGDVIDLTGSGTDNVLNAVFAPIDTGATVTFGPPWFQVTVPIPGPNFISTPILGVQTWNLSTTQPFTYVAINGGSEVSGVTTINMNNSAADSAIRVGVGGPGFQPLSAPVTTLGASNDGADGELQVVVAASAMTAAADVHVTVNLNNVGASSEVTQDYPGGYVGNAFEVSEGPNQGWINTADGVKAWTLDAAGNDYLYLGTNGSQAATSVTINGSGNLTVWGNGTDWQHVTSINASGYAGNLILTGYTYDSGFLSDPASLKSLQGGSGNNIFDLSGMTLAELKAMTLIDGGFGGTNTVILANDVLDGITAALPAGLTDFTVIGDAGNNGPGSADPGTIDWADLGTGATQLTFFGDLYNGGPGFDTLTVNNAPTDFTVNLQDNDFDTINWAFNAAHDVLGASNSLTINFGCSLDNDASTGVDGNWAVKGYDSITLDSTGYAQSYFNGSGEGIGDFTATPTPGGTVVVDVIGNGEITIGQVDGLGLGDIGTPTVSIDGGSIIGSNTGALYLGITDASVIDDSAGGSLAAGGLYMSGPDSNTSADLLITGSVAGFNLLQGSLGPLVHFPVNSNGAYFGVAGAATINGGNAGDSIYDTGGVETIHLSATSTGGDSIFYSDFSLNNNANADNGLLITNDHGGYSFLGTQFDNGLATVTNFISGAAANDSVTFDPDSWGFGGSSSFGPGTYKGLTDSQGFQPGGNTVFWTVAAGGNVPTIGAGGHDINFLVFDPNNAYVDGTLQGAINGGTVGFTTSHNFTGNTYSMLFAFNNGAGTTIADVQFDTVGAQHTVHVDSVHDLVDLVGVTTTALAPANVHFI